MKTTTWVIIIVAIAVVAGLWLWFGFQPNSAGQTINTTPVATSTGTGTEMGSGSTGSSFDQSISDGTITLRYASADFGLATNQQQILVKAVIPPCDASFNYCLYFDNSSTYAGTNFESAGIRIQKRADLGAERLCLNTPPEGFDAATQPIASSSANTYSTSVFSVGGGAAGNIANGSLYRLYIRSSGACYEFETRIAQSQFANYPPGTIHEFTSSNQSALQAEINDVLNATTLSSGETVSFQAAK